VFDLSAAGFDAEFELPTGADDIVLLEAGTLDLGVAVTFLARVVSRPDAPLNWMSLSMTDIDVLLLRLRQRLLGDAVRAEIVCAAKRCRAWADIVFSIDDYLDHHRPKRPSRVVALTDGWFRLVGEDVEFRVPSVGDQLAVMTEQRPEQALLHRCVRQASITSRLRRRVETAMEAMAPSLASELQGTCPECGSAVTAWFDPLHYTLRELRDQAAFVYEEVCAIARLTHWSEAEILSLPAVRRARYAELAQPGMAGV
jgi:hypothetical protein